MGGFDRYIGPETWLQKTIIDYITMQYPKWVVVHPPNEGKRSPFERYLLKLLGVKSGASDLIIFAPGAVLCLEVKAGKNTLTPAQSDFLTSVNALGHSATWCNNFDAARVIIDTFANNLKSA